MIRASARCVLPALLLLAGACSDHNPVAGTPGAPEPRMQRLECTASVRAGTLACTDASRTGGARGDLLVGGGFVKVTSTGVFYDAPTGLNADVTVQNLTSQPIGTSDGTTADSSGVKVFFHSGPTVTQGSGSVTVANADGTDAFTGAAQPFFRYTGVLQPLETSPSRHWRFAVDAGVETFTFVLYVAVPVANETGRVDVTPAHPYVQAGTTRQLTATVRTGAGGVLTGQTVTWASSNDSIATVDASGVVTALAAGTVTITATSGARTGGTKLTVTSGQGDVTAPSLAGFSFTPEQVDVTGGSMLVNVTMVLDDAGSGAGVASVMFRSPTGAHDLSCNTSQFSGTAAHATFQCGVLVPQGSEAGIWKPAFVAVRDQVNNVVSVPLDELEAAGFRTSLRIDSTPDSVAPAVTALSFTPDSIDITSAAQNVTVSLSATDGGTGMSLMSIMLRSPTGTHDLSCSSSTLASGTPQNGTFQCTAVFPHGTETGDWQVAFVTVRDWANNIRFMTGTELSAAGLPTVVHVRGTSDSEAPTLTSFGFTPDSVDVRTQSRQTTVTLGVDDAGTGFNEGSSNVVFRSPSGNQTVSCQPTTPVSGTEQSGTWQCQLTIPAGAEGGNWQVGFLVLRDQTNNLRQVSGSDLATAGYPVTLKVTSN